MTEFDTEFDFQEGDGFESVPQPSLDDVIRELKKDSEGIPSAVILYGLSDLSDSDIETIKPLWLSLVPDYRRKLLRMMVDVSEFNFEMNYRKFATFALSDSDAGVRAAAIETLWEDETVALMNKLIQLATQDPAIEVRAQAAIGLARFILLGEYEEISEQDAKCVQDTVYNIFTNSSESFEVRRRALEAFANSSNKTGCEIHPRCVSQRKPRDANQCDFCNGAYL